VCIYSTFLQRAIDHIIHDATLQKLPVIFTLDRAGLVGADGPTHHGTFDLSYLPMIPGMVVAAPRDGNEFRDLLETAVAWEKGPFAIRYPKDNSYRFDPDSPGRRLPVGSWVSLRGGSDLALVAVGSMVEEALECAANLENRGLSVEVINARFVKPMDQAMIAHLAESHRWVVSLEENSEVNGFGAQLLARLTAIGYRGRYSLVGIPDQFIEHGERSILMDLAGLSASRLTTRLLAEAGLPASAACQCRDQRATGVIRPTRALTKPPRRPDPEGTGRRCSCGHRSTEEGPRWTADSAAANGTRCTPTCWSCPCSPTENRTRSSGRGWRPSKRPPA
jgi:1-deoxy-D-xylulose-5-phosphate synthase